MTHQEYRRALDAAILEYETLGAKRREIDQRLAELAQTIGILSRLLGLTPTVPMGLTDAIRLVIRGAGVPMTPVEVRDRLGAIGFDVSRYTNDLAAVHTILKRLNHAGELRFVPRTPGKHQYIWNHGVGVVALTPDIVRVMHDNAGEREAMTATTGELEKRPRDRRPGRRGSSATKKAR